MSETKKVWGHIGMTFHLTEEEFRILQAGGSDAAELIFQKVKGGEAYLDGWLYRCSREFLIHRNQVRHNGFRIRGDELIFCISTHC